MEPGQRRVWQTDRDGYLIGESVADPDPMNEGQWLMPAGCVSVMPPRIPEGKWPRWVNGGWQLIDIQREESPD